MMGRAIGSIRDRSTFRALRRPAGSARRGPVRVTFVPGPDAGAPRARVGYVIGKRCGNAVERNRLRRRCREVARTVAPDVPAGSYLIRAEPGATQLDFSALAGAVRQAMTAAGREAAR